MQTITKFGVAAAAFISMTAAATASQAAVYIALQQAGVNGGAITLQSSGATFAAFAGSYGTFGLDLSTGSFADPVLLDSTSANTSTATPGTLDVYVTRDDIAGPLTPFGYRSSFTQNIMPVGWSVRQRTYVDAGNGLYGGTLLGDVTFGANGTAIQFDAPVPGAGPYSVTTRYTITATGFGSTLSTATLTAVPEPGTWALMIMGFGGAGAMLRSRRRKAALAA